MEILLYKTEKARWELSPGVRTLSLRERSLLLLAEGTPLAQLNALYHGAGAQMVEHLRQQGYLDTKPPRRPARDSTPPSLEPLPEAMAPPIAEHAPTACVPPAATPAGRSLAGARMHLFDLCERLFARRDPARAAHYRDALRAARDEAGMLAVGCALLRDVAAHAGPQRALSLGAELAALWPHDEWTATWRQAAAEVEPALESA
ncbi:MAG: hypothetical protein ACK40S_13960 [Burkholderiaceae bacterium]